MRSLRLLPLVFVSAALSCQGSGGDEPLIISRTRTSPALSHFNSCGELTAKLRANLKEEMRTQLLQLKQMYEEMNRGGLMVDEATAAPEADGSQAGANDTSSLQEGTDFSGTNNQEAGVDEADFVKTDGAYIYLLNGNRLEVLSVPEPGALAKTSFVAFEGHPRQMLLGDDHAVVFSTIYTGQLPPEHPLRVLVGDTDAVTGYGWWYRSKVLTKLTVVDITDREDPKLVRELYLEGRYQTARKVDSSVRMVAYSWMEIPGVIYYPEWPDSLWEPSGQIRQEALDRAIANAIAHNNQVIDATPLAKFVPQLYVREQQGNIVPHAFTNQDCRQFAIADDGMSRGFTSIISLDLLGDLLAFDSTHIVTNWSQVYSSLETLVIAEHAQDWWWYWRNDDFLEATNIHRFDISQPGRTIYAGSGRVDGTVLDQFCLSEYEGAIRVASTTGQWNRWWLEDRTEPENHIFVLQGDEAPSVVGHLGGIAKGERIWSARFVRKRAFLVTFRNIDPLWTIDLSDPSRPAIMGELEVPGVSTYIHPLDDDHLLTIGFGGDENGLDWATQLSLFNVSNFASPELTESLPLKPEPGDGWSYAWSEATWEHKAFQYWWRMSMLGIPLSTYRWDYTTDRYEYYSHLKLLKVDPATGFQEYASIDHSDFFNSAPNTYWRHRDVRRSIFYGDLETGYVYAISDRGVTCHKISDMSLTASVELPGSLEEPYWYWN